MTLSQKSLSAEPALTDEPTLSAAVNTLSEHLDLETHDAVSCIAECRIQSSKFRIEIYVEQAFQ